VPWYRSSDLLEVFDEPAGSAASRQLVGERAGYRSVEREVAEDAAVTGIAADRAHSTDADRPFADKREILSSARAARHEFS
jgi:hypothetical protein